MAIEVNFNNKNRHWVLVILSRIKNGLNSLCLGFWHLLQRTWKYLLGIFVAIAIVILSILGYTYYTKEYYPEKILNKAVEGIIHNFDTEQDTEKKLYLAYDILNPEFTWICEDVDSELICVRLKSYHEYVLHFIESKALAGNATGQFLLGYVHDIFNDDKDKAAYWWNEAAIHGCVDAYNNIGICYQYGEGVNIDLDKAVMWLKKGAESGEAWAQLNWGRMYINGVKKKVGEKKKIREGYYTLWDMVPVYKTLVPKDIEKAKEWWRKSAAQGNEEAKELLQKIYN